MPKPKQFACTHPDCGKKFRSRSAMGQHFRSMHAVPNAANIPAPPGVGKPASRSTHRLFLAVGSPLIVLFLLSTAYYFGALNGLLKALQ